MIRDPGVARKLIETLEGMCRQLDESTEMVRRDCPEDEFKAFLRERAQISGRIFYNLLDPLYGEHPDLAPAEAPEELKERWRIRKQEPPVG